MMRFIENDYQIKGVISSSLILGVDRPEDIQKVEMIMRQDNLVKTYKKKYI
jgi:CMP-2-keto-3-deoxyoctulosonic acid synthetase